MAFGKQPITPPTPEKLKEHKKYIKDKIKEEKRKLKKNKNS